MLDDVQDEGQVSESSEAADGGSGEFYLDFDDGGDADGAEAATDSGGDAEAATAGESDGDRQQAAKPDTSPAAPPQQDAEPSYVTELRAQLQQANDRYDQLQQEFGPYFQNIRTQAQQQASRPPLTPEQIRSGQFTAEQFEQYMDWKVEQRLARVQNDAVSATTYQQSQMQARAMFTPEAMGDPNLSYDKLVGDYFAPAYAQNPALKQAVATIIPENPAAGEMLVGAFLRLYHANGQDIGKAVRAMHGKAAATAKPGADPRRAAQQRQADRVIRESGGGRGKKIDMNAPQAFDRMSSQDFERFMEQTGDAGF